MAILTPERSGDVSDRGSSASAALVPLPQAAINLPVAGSAVPRSVLQIAGWAMTAAGPCARVELTVNGRPVGRARLGEYRPDAAALTGVGSARLSGFVSTVNLAELPTVESVAELSGMAIGMDGERVPLAPVSVSVTDQHAAAGRPRRPRTVRARSRDALQLLICTHELGYGGAQLFLLELLRTMGPVGGLVISPADGPTGDELADLGFEVHITLPYPIWSPDEYEIRLQELAGWARPRDFDAALVNTIVSFPGADLCMRLGVPTVWAIHDSYPLPELWASYGDRLDPVVRERGETALKATGLAAFTADATRALYEPYVPGLPCATLPYGIDVDALDDWRGGFDRPAARRELQIADDAVVLLCMGTIEPRKSQTQLIYAFSLLAERHPDALLLLVGSRGDRHSDAAHEVVAAHGLERNVRIMPVVADARPLYGIADVIVSASDVESTPRSLLEAMALRLPILSTDVFGIPELICDGETGWLFPARDVSEIARALDRVLSLAPDERAVVAARARAVVEARYRSEICSREWRRALETVAGTRSAASA